MMNLDPRRARWMRVRIGILVALLGLGFSRLVLAAWDLQVRRAPTLQQEATQQYTRRVEFEPRRGTLFDRHHNPLAVSVPSPSLASNPTRLAMAQGRRRRTLDVHRLAGRLAEALHMTSAEVLERLGGHRGFAWVKRHMTDDEARAVREVMAAEAHDLDAARIDGLDVVEESRRWYPQRENAAHITGFAGGGGQGLEGLELSLDDHLRGRTVAVEGLRDAHGNLVFADGLRPGEGQAGEDVVLAIDSTLQMIAARELALTCQTVEARGGSLIITDPNTGELLAMASYPTYNPNEFAAADPESRRNRAIADRFEPGSTMKIFSVGGALDAGVVHPGQLINCYGGTYSVGNLTIHDAHPDTWLTPMMVLARSSNIGAAQIGAALGSDGLERAFRRFGFGERTGIPLPGEARARFGERRWYEVEVATVAFGQGIGVTALQLSQAVGAVANGGRLVHPLLVSRISDPTGEIVEEHAPDAGRPAMQPAVARLLSEMLTTVTEEGGTGTEAAIPGVRVAGKTGTAQKANEHARGYDATRWVSSFIGFAPADHPRLAITVVIDEPQLVHAGGAVAAPLFRRVMEQSLRYLGALPTQARPGQATVMPAMSPSSAVRPSPSANATDRTPDGVTPDLMGVTARQAMRRLNPLGVEAVLEGSGVIVRQEPSPGEALPEDRTVRLWLEPAGGYTPVPLQSPASTEVPR